MKRLAALAFVAFANACLAQGDPATAMPPPSERWFSLDRTSSGYVAAGNLAGTLWAFHVRGFQMKRLGGAASTMFSIDGVVMQVRPVPRSVIKGAASGALQAHKRYEQEHQAATNPNLTFGDHDLCRGAKVPFEQWTAQRAGDAMVQAYVTFEVGDYVMMVVAPYENEARRKAVARALEDVCTSFQREKVA
ncbi:MAG TPA: hypothetical protein VM051_07230 [Usitatibacter sp.]|nr:hypothetical protein [Usitatibacter sp.]